MELHRQTTERIRERLERMTRYFLTVPKEQGAEGIMSITPDYALAYDCAYKAAMRFESPYVPIDPMTSLKNVDLRHLEHCAKLTSLQS